MAKINLLRKLLNDLKRIHQWHVEKNRMHRKTCQDLDVEEEIKYYQPRTPLPE